MLRTQPHDHNPLHRNDVGTRPQVAQHYRPIAPITLRLGGATGVDVRFSPIMRSFDELQQVNQLIAHIESIDLNVYSFSEETFQTFIHKLYELSHLPCLAHEYEVIHDALCFFCRDFIQSSPWNPVPKNFPGYIAYYGEFRYREYLTHFIQDSLMDAMFIKARSNFVIQSVIDERVSYKEWMIYNWRIYK